MRDLLEADEDYDVSICILHDFAFIAFLRLALAMYL